MQKLIKAFENIMVAVTFAEAGEYDDASKLSGQEKENEEMAVSVAENMKAAGRS